MSLQIRFDHRFERLADALLDAFDERCRSPLAERVVVVPSAGVARWLQRRDAQRHGVSARIRTEFAGRWLWQTMRLLLPGLPPHSPFEPERARWALMPLFDELPGDPAFAVLRARAGEPGSRARLQLADSVARAFERYLAYRRDWLAQWQQGRWADGRKPLGPHEPWQRWLWQRLLERLPDVRDEHPYDQFARLLAETDPDYARATLAGRVVAVFGRVDLSPEQFALFGRLSQWMDVSLFAPDPCRELWSDMVDSTQLARIREQRPDAAWLYEGEPSLLGNWGRVQRDFVAQVLTLEDSFGVQAEAPGREEAVPYGEAASPGAARDCLDALHRAVFLRSDAAWAGVRGADASIVVRGAHGPVREAELLHEALLESFEAIPGLRPDEVVVQCVDIDAAARAIEGVFAAVPEARRIPVAISGRPARADALVDAVQTLLSIAVHGIDAASLDAWLRNAAVMEALSLDEPQRERLLGWFDEAGMRRGLDAEDGSAKHSLRAATERLLLGAAFGSAEVCADRLAVPGAQGSRAHTLEAWLPAAEALGRLRRLGGTLHAPADWCVTVSGIVETLFGHVRRHAGGLQRVRDAFGQLAATTAGARGVAIDAPAFAQILADRLEDTAAAAMPTGAVTVCPIGSLRGVPFRVVCLFGADEDAFPRRGTSDEIDLMRRAPRFGDRLARNDDRGIFLDVVLAARERLVVLCRSRDARDDSALNPSPLVAELLSYLDARLDSGQGVATPGLVRERRGATSNRPALVEHPLHAFSVRNFAGGTNDYAAEWLPTARALATPLPKREPVLGALFELSSGDECGETPRVDPAGAPHGDPAGAPQGGAGPGASADGGMRTIESIARALSDPAATWLRSGLGVALPRDADAPPEFEPLWSDERAERVLVQRAAERLLAGDDEERLAREMVLAPATAAGAAGERQARGIVRRALDLVQRVTAGSDGLVGMRSAAPPVVAQVAGVGLRMERPAVDSNRRVVFVSAFPTGAPALFDAWLRTALWRLAVDPQATGRLVTLDDRFELLCPDPRRSLEHALQWADRIAREPLALFPRSWLQYALALSGADRRDGNRGKGKGKGKDKDDEAKTAAMSRYRALARARTALLGSDFAGPRPEIDRPAMLALYRDAEIDFEQVLPLCERAYRPVFDDLAPDFRDAGQHE